MELDLLVSAIQQKPIIIEPPCPYIFAFPRYLYTSGDEKDVRLSRCYTNLQSPFIELKFKENSYPIFDNRCLVRDTTLAPHYRVIEGVAPESEGSKS